MNQLQFSCTLFSKQTCSHIFRIFSYPVAFLPYHCRSLLSLTIYILLFETSIVNKATCKSRSMILLRDIPVRILLGRAFSWFYINLWSFFTFEALFWYQNLHNLWYFTSSAIKLSLSYWFSLFQLFVSLPVIHNK